MHAVLELDGRPRGLLALHLLKSGADEVDPGELTLTDTRNPGPETPLSSLQRLDKCQEASVVGGGDAGPIFAGVSSREPRALRPSQGDALRERHTTHQQSI